MAISSINSLTKLRLTGLSSGMDTDAIIKSMMQIEQLKINRQYRARTTLQWKQEALGGVKTDLSTFFNDFISTIGSKSMMNDSAYNAFKAELTGKNTTAATVSTSVHASPGKVTINSITQIATASEVSSGDMNRAVITGYGVLAKVADGETAPNSSTKLKDLVFKDGNNLEFDQSEPSTTIPGAVRKFFSVDINGETFKFYQNDTIDDMLTKVNSNRNAGVTMSYSSYNGGFSLSAKSVGDSITIENATGNSFGSTAAFGIATGTYEVAKGVSANGMGLGSTASQTALKDLNFAQKLVFDNGEISFRINGQTFSFKETDTLGKMMSTINNSDIGVTMSYSELTDGFTFKTKTTGADTSLSISNLKGNAFGTTSAFGVESGNYSNGKNAIAKINGVNVTSSKNDFTYDGINYRLNAATDDPIEITITRDVSEPLERIKEFVNGYNTLIKKLEGLLKDKKSKDEQTYVALTDDEKAEMTEKQIEDWEAIAKKGILRNDAGIQTLVSRLRGALFESVSSAGLSPSQIGLSTGNYFSGNGGQISLDEDKLKAALEADPQAVMNIFKSYDDPVNPTYEGSGLLTRINKIFGDYNKGAGEMALDSIEYSLQQVTDKITAMQQKMLDKEEKLYKQYAAMETALSKMQSQSDWLSGVLGSMNG